MYGDNFIVAGLGYHCPLGRGVALYRLFPDDRRCCHLDSALVGCDAVLIGKVIVESDATLFLRNPVTRRHAPEDLSVQQHRCEHLKSGTGKVNCYVSVQFSSVKFN